jgi:hypothetical protein
MKKYTIYISLGILLVILVIIFTKNPIKQQSSVMQTTPTPTLVPATPTPFVFTKYSPPKIEKKPIYKIAMIADSMTAALGPHGGELADYMNSLYKTSDQQRIIIDNYAKSSNLQAVKHELYEKTSINEYTFGPLLSENYDLILVESYAYNPLSQYGVTEGIKQQNEALDKLMTTLITTRPHMAIVFVATIAPNKKMYAKTTHSGSTATERGKEADERIAYLQNHIDYATKHAIPLINIYQKSLTANGDGNIIYINPTDDIHPSFAGVTFIGREIGDYIHTNQILPK